MPIEVACSCGKKLKAPDNFAGKRAKCPGCGKPLLIPMPAEEEIMTAEVVEDDDPPSPPQKTAAPVRPTPTVSRPVPPPPTSGAVAQGGIVIKRSGPSSAPAKPVVTRPNAVPAAAAARDKPPPLQKTSAIGKPPGKAEEGEDFVLAELIAPPPGSDGGNPLVWVLPNSSRDLVFVITRNTLHLAEMAPEKAEAARKAIEKGEPISETLRNRDTVVPLADIDSIESKSGSKKFSILLRKEEPIEIDCGDAATKKEVFRDLKEQWNCKYDEGEADDKPKLNFSTLRPPIVTVLGTIVLLVLAVYDGKGSSSSRGNKVSAILYLLNESLGRTGMLALFGLLCAAALGWLIFVIVSASGGGSVETLTPRRAKKK